MVFAHGCEGAGRAGVSAGTGCREVELVQSPGDAKIVKCSLGMGVGAYALRKDLRGGRGKEGGVF